MSECSPKIIRRPSECFRSLSVRMSRYRCVTRYNVYDYVMYSRVPGWTRAWVSSSEKIVNMAASVSSSDWEQLK